MKIQSYISFIFIALLLSSCEDFFDTTLEIDPPTHDKRISLVSRAFAGDSIVLMNIRGSLGVLDNAEFPLVEGLSIVFLHNGKLVEVVEDSINIGYQGLRTVQYKANLVTNLKTGDVLEVTASGVGYPEIYATDTVPAQPIVEEGSFLLDGGRNVEGDEVSEVSFYYRSNGISVSYFIPKLFTKQVFCARAEFENGQYVCLAYDTLYNLSRLDLEDPSVIEGTEGPLVIHHVEDGRKPYTCQINKYIFSNNPGQNEIKPFLEVVNVSKAYYNYDQSVNSYSQNNDNPFATPTNVKSNVRNGYGILQLANKIAIPLKIE